MTNVKSEMIERKTLLIITPGRTRYQTAIFNLLVAETGEHLASHICSNYSFAFDDLYWNRDDRKEEYLKRFGEVEVKFIDETNITEDELIKRNAEWWESVKLKKYEA